MNYAVEGLQLLEEAGFRSSRSKEITTRSTPTASTAGCRSLANWNLLDLLEPTG